MEEKMELLGFPVLRERNAHPRDRNVSLEEYTHVYDVAGFLPSTFTSVTAWKEKLFPKFDKEEISRRCVASGNPRYAGKTAKEVQKTWEETSELGTEFHHEVERFLNDNSLPPDYCNADLLRLHELAFLEEGPERPVESTEWKHFMRFVRDHPDLRPYRTEWRIYHEEYKIVGTLDALFKVFHPKLERDIFLILDWKRTGRKIVRTELRDRKPLEPTLWFAQDSDYWQYAVQLNLYRIILMDKYDIRSDHMYVVRFHPQARKYQVVRLPNLDHWLRPLLKAKAK